VRSPNWGDAEDILSQGNGCAPFAELDQADFLDEDDALGQLYQAMNADAMESAYRATARDRRKFSTEEIPSVSQLFTPKWVVEFLLHNTLGKRWMEWHPDSRLLPRLHFLLPPGPCEATSSGKRAADLRILDPACGTMNFGLVAFDMLRVMYREEIERAGDPGWPAEPSSYTDDAIADSIAANNLHGIDIDPMALRLARASLDLKAGRIFPPREWNLILGDSLFDDSIARGMAGRFDVVVTNPPYVSSRNLSKDHVRKMKKRFPHGWRDLYACFIERAIDFTCETGRVGLLAMQSFMFTGAYEALRGQIVERSSIDTLAHFGPGLFGVGNPGTLQTVAFTARRKSMSDVPRDEPLLAIRLTQIPETEKQEALRMVSLVSSPITFSSGYRNRGADYLPIVAITSFHSSPKNMGLLDRRVSPQRVRMFSPAGNDRAAAARFGDDG
jgi:type I restriction-modification system DNA methylase subunit